ncbi:MFS transporter [Rubrobacter xylanophilus]|uniref:MFS transporter n=1 Tax=Rubrobacter xylanophilus TaxID=49319 RepID=UPI001C63F5AF|nr:MFS transporter [Rubrobacter xylanophilus]
MARRPWSMVVALAAIVNVGYGTIFYSFSVLLGEGAAVGDFGRTVLSVALGLGVVVSGVLAPLVGTVCDVAGPRRVFLCGAVLGFAGLAGFSRAGEGWHVIVVWGLLLGPAMACTFYEPAYVAIDQWFERSQGTALGILTLIAGLSATIFIPLTQLLVEALGWRDATLTLGVVLLFAGGGLAAAAVRDRPREQSAGGLQGVYRALITGARGADGSFWLITAAFFLALAAMFGMLFHQVAYLQDLGFPPQGVAAAAGIVGIASLPARFLLPALSDLLGPWWPTAGVLAALAASALLLPGAKEWWRIYAYVGLFGAAFGAVLPLRAAIMARRFGGPRYGRLMGLQQVFLALAMAAGPSLGGLARDATGSYTPAWFAASILCLAAVPPLLAAARWSRTSD